VQGKNCSSTTLSFFFGRFFFGLETVPHKANLHNPFCRFGIWKIYTAKMDYRGVGCKRDWAPLVAFWKTESTNMFPWNAPFVKCTHAPSHAHPNSKPSIKSRWFQIKKCNLSPTQKKWGKNTFSQNWFLYNPRPIWRIQFAGVKKLDIVGLEFSCYWPEMLQTHACQQ
jgi:hypothetical protein